LFHDRKREEAQGMGVIETKIDCTFFLLFVGSLWNKGAFYSMILFGLDRHKDAVGDGSITWECWRITIIPPDFPSLQGRPP